MRSLNVVSESISRAIQYDHRCDRDNNNLVAGMASKARSRSDAGSQVVSLRHHALRRVSGAHQGYPDCAFVPALTRQDERR